MATFRGFIAVDIEAFGKLEEFEQAIQRTGAQVKLVEPHNVHITLKFLGETQESHIDEIERIMKEAVADVTSFHMQLRGSGVFPNEHYIKVIWIGIESSEQLGSIAQHLDHHLARLGYKKERRGFSPHLTIGRVKTARAKEQLLEVINTYRTTEFTTIPVYSIRLMKSELTPKGPIYTLLRDVHFPQ
jgi:2'-5' RNA ligase